MGNLKAIKVSQKLFKVRFVRDKRASSEIIGSLMLLLAISTAGVILYSFSIDYFSSSIDAFRVESELDSGKIQERLIITAVWYDGNLMNITILNYGKIEWKIDQVYFNHIQVSSFISGRGVAVGPKELISVKFTPPISIVAGNTYEIVVVTERGSKNAIYWEA